MFFCFQKRLVMQYLLKAFLRKAALVAHDLSLQTFFCRLSQWRKLARLCSQNSSASRAVSFVDHLYPTRSTASCFKVIKLRDKHRSKCLVTLYLEAFGGHWLYIETLSWCNVCDVLTCQSFEDRRFASVIQAQKQNPQLLVCGGLELSEHGKETHDWVLS